MVFDISMYIYGYIIFLVMAQYSCHNSNENKLNYRLNDDVKPSLYYIAIKPYLLDKDVRQFTFDGEVRISLKTQKKYVQNITLHAKKLEIKTVNFHEEGKLSGHPIINAKYSFQNETEMMTVHLSEYMESDVAYVLDINYHGNIEEEPRGFWRTSYENDQNETVWMAVTHLEPTNARKLFPCFDEPRFKAKFNILLEVEKGYKAYTNTEIISNNSGIMYNITPIMSTYLIALFITDYAERKLGDNDVISILYQNADLDRTDFALENSPKLLKLLEEFTDIPYKYSGQTKLHLAGIPDFPTGAMENWGLIFFKEYVLLSDPDNEFGTNESILTSIAHELSHMWFGNLVTTQWWGHVWLNEGFATYFQYFIVNQLMPHMELEKSFPVLVMQAVFETDLAKNSHPLHDVAVESSEDCFKMFSDISYQKGASIVRMVSYMMGPNKFKKAIQLYLKRHMYKTVTISDFQNAMEVFWSDKNSNLTEFFEKWTKQTGYPLVTFEISLGNEISVKQEKFKLLSGIDSTDEKSEKTWIIPITYMVNEGIEETRPRFYLSSSKESITVRNGSKNSSLKWIIGNVYQTGYYRVSYDENTWREIGNALKAENFSEINVMNRAQIVDDILVLGENDYLGFDIVLEVLEYLKNETDYLPWTPALKYFTQFFDKLDAVTIRYFEKYLGSILVNVYKEVLNLSDNDLKNRMQMDFRESIKISACRSGVEDCINDSLQVMEDWDGETPIPRYQMCAAVQTNPSAYWDKLFEIIKEEVSLDLIMSLTCVRDENYLRDFLQHVIENFEDPAFAIYAMKESPIMKDVYFEFVVENFMALDNRTEDKDDMEFILECLAEVITNDEQLEKLNELTRNYLDEDDTEQNQEINNIAKTSISWIEKHSSKIREYLQKTFTI